MKYVAKILLTLIVLVPFGCKSKNGDAEVSDVSSQHRGKHLVSPGNGFQHRVSCAIKVGQRGAPPAWQSAPEIAVARKQVELLISKLGSLKEYNVCVDIFLNEKERALKLDSKSCAARECAPPVTGLQRLSGGADTGAQDGNFVSRTTVYFNEKTRGEKEQTSIFLSENRMHLTWRITDDISKPDFKVNGQELASWARQNSASVCAAIRKKLKSNLDRDQIYSALSDEFRASGLDDQEAGIVAEIVNDEGCRWQ